MKNQKKYNLTAKTGQVTPIRDCAGFNMDTGKPVSKLAQVVFNGDLYLLFNN